MPTPAERREALSLQIERLVNAKPESAEQWGEICRLEAEMEGGPWFDNDDEHNRCPDCGHTPATGACFYCRMD